MTDTSCPYCRNRHPVFRNTTTKLRVIASILRASHRAIRQVFHMANSMNKEGTETMGGEGRAWTAVNEPQGPYAEVIVSWHFTDRTVGSE